MINWGYLQKKKKKKKKKKEEEAMASVTEHLESSIEDRTATVR